MNNLRQINLGVRMYADDANDKSPGKAAGGRLIFTGYKELMKSYVGLRGASSPRDRLFACPADVYYYDTAFGKRHPRPDYEGYVPESWCAQSNSDFTSYVFNAGNLFGPTKKVALPGIAGMTLSSIKHPSRTVLVTEAPALIPFSWHQPRRLLFEMMRAGIDCRTSVLQRLDEHGQFRRWPCQLCENILEILNKLRVFRPHAAYDPPDGYDYQWSGN